ncbi:hypothetical protein VZT92_005809 [Zoarces viviparus]|uniref:Uncharacterized protein n=1 Tax=Zoarces viviparus TaxID=48416 RepID=A0AAW1FMS4_ZOAVI
MGFPLTAKPRPALAFKCLYQWIQSKVKDERGHGVTLLHGDVSPFLYKASHFGRKCLIRVSKMRHIVMVELLLFQCPQEVLV